MGKALPHPLRAAIAVLAGEHAGRDLKTQVARQSALYRSHGTSAALLAQQDAAAYATVRMPATFAAVATVLDVLANAAPGFAPLALLDAGCGTGSAAFAALDRFPGVRTVHLIDHNRTLLDVAIRLGDLAGFAQGRDLHKQVTSLENASLPPADLVTLSYALVEMAEIDAARLTLRLFAAARQALVLVEPGSRAGFQRILQARTALISAGAQVLAPCTHSAACQLPSPDWCHFSVRLARSRDHLRAKSASAPFEDEPFSYLVAWRGAFAASPAERILAPPKITKGGAELRCCGMDGIATRRFPARDPRFRQVKKCQWGDAIEPLTGLPAEQPPLLLQDWHATGNTAIASTDLHTPCAGTDVGEVPR